MAQPFELTTVLIAYFATTLAILYLHYRYIAPNVEIVLKRSLHSRNDYPDYSASW